MKVVNEAMHVSTAPPNIVYREGEQKKVLEYMEHQYFKSDRSLHIFKRVID